VAIEFLPVGEILSVGTEGKELEKALSLDESESLFEPGPEDVLEYLLSHYINIYIYQTLLNAKASEQSARMVSMKNATENAETLIEDLKLEYNKLRQGNITRDLLDIAGGQSG
jgi:F-type H+-transporting ATPase subunit gamma